MTNINTVNAKVAIYNVSECGDTNQLKRWLNQEMAESGKGRVTVRDAIFRRIGEILVWKDEKEQEIEMEEEDYGLIQMLDKIQKKDEKNYEEEGEKMSINIDDHQKKIKFLEWLNFQEPVADNYIGALRVRKINNHTVNVWILGMFYKENRKECYQLLKEIGQAAKKRGFKVSYEKPPRGMGYMKITTK